MLLFCAGYGSPASEALRQAQACNCLDAAEFGEELRLHKAQPEALGTQAGPLALWVRTAIANKKMRNSLQYVYYAGGGVVGALIAGQCSC